MRGTGIAMIFQDPMTSLNPVYTIGWQIAEAIRAHQDISKEAAQARAIELLAKVGIPNPAERVDNYPHEFSGGMRQRAVIAIGMANDPDVILADEPTTALDVTVQAQVLESLKTALTETGAALLLITHDLGVIAGLADRVLVMYAGRPVEVGTADDVFYKPSMPYTLGLLGSLPRLDSDGTERLRQIPGSPPSMLGTDSGCPFAPRCPLRADICTTTEPPLVVVPSVDSARGDHRAACHFAEAVAAGEHGGALQRRRAPAWRRHDRSRETDGTALDAERPAAAPRGDRPGQALPRCAAAASSGTRSARSTRSAASPSASRRARRSGWSGSPAAASRRPGGPSCS